MRYLVIAAVILASIAPAEAAPLRERIVARVALYGFLPLLVLEGVIVGPIVRVKYWLDMRRELNAVEEYDRILDEKREELQKQLDRVLEGKPESEPLPLPDAPPEGETT